MKKHKKQRCCFKKDFNPMLCLKPAHIIIMKKAPTLNDDEPVRSWAVGTGGRGAGGAMAFPYFGRSVNPKNTAD